MFGEQCCCEAGQTVSERGGGYPLYQLTQGTIFWAQLLSLEGFGVEGV